MQIFEGVALETNRIVSNLSRLVAATGDSEIEMIAGPKTGPRFADHRDGFLEPIMVRVGLRENIDEAFAA